jgi:hypothetical protein
MFNWNFKSNLTWLKGSTIFLTIHGSRAYGKNIEGSDIDYRGFCIAPEKYYFGFLDNFEQVDLHEPEDVCIFDLRKFLKLASEANPNVLEILFTDPSSHILNHKVNQVLFDNRDLFLSKKVKFTFFGYAFSQMKRIKTHKSWLSNPIKEPPKREDFGLPEYSSIVSKDQMLAAEAEINKKLAKWNLTDLDNFEPAARQSIKELFNETLLDITGWNWSETEEKLYLAAAHSIGVDDNFLEVIKIERKYNLKKKEFEQYQNWLKTRNPKRAAIEFQFGYDTKHAYHLVRLCRMCLEILQDKKVLVKRPDAEELIRIRNGDWSYDKLLEWFEGQENILNTAYQNSTLPHSPNKSKIDEICIKMIKEFLYG